MTTSITIKIDTSHAAFDKSIHPNQRGAEVGRILALLATAYMEDGVGVLSRKIHDVNGNACGSLKDVVRDRQARSKK